MSAMTLAGSPGPVLVDGHPARLVAERAQRVLKDARRLWASALDEARHHFRVWRLEREMAHMMRALDRLNDRQLAVLGLDRLTMLDVIEERLVAREFGAIHRTLLLPTAP